ncbi:sugar phosphate isomerase/epimerase [Paenibacillus psychroresistens]|uniref:Sugar phosphate isomerase/epimerase n=1 Tax=Paenibacillus psychroresistens TaxID=1778678 RepID=A0A6B8RUR3_9BACL|nr:sugar phosphate isomerase/epimerase family protein [Paenibacillus psychroresistens]QGQ99036.1 sugar phosphate isomerase/epimerase [Paenibacillus psychroresistens]
MNSFGWCTDLKDAELLAKLGFDYIELALAPMQLENQEEYRRQLKLVQQSPLPVKAFNVFFPQDIKIVGPAADVERIRRYIATAVEVFVKAGARIAVLGSGGARTIPEGWETARAEEQLLQVLNWCAAEMKDTGVILAIEPLNRKESNVINSVADGVYYAKQINDPAVRVLADFYHMDEENEPLSTLREHKDWLAHIHLADTGRRNPGSGQYDYDTFSAILREIGYSGMISAECKVEQQESEMVDSLRFMKSKWR